MASSADGHKRELIIVEGGEANDRVSHDQRMIVNSNSIVQLLDEPLIADEVAHLNKNKFNEIYIKL